ncbi:uncharacterized protein N7459_004949 [Penicillium hispanicum]|uniref:uncharacterized protein n=1 Tax=Penicillium hispanicum TaxID=1080232 RepID=UPI00253F9947|nr:uncharacterized protein N7459_004949 [Penicillium hispanicum]KAJ5585149.1 hypothetical protein N7459_004949 [Penicillium hispanicum]
MEARREPSRAGQALNAEFGTHIIGNGIQNIKYALIKVIGRLADYTCLSCRLRFGPWTECVVVDGTSDLNCCANCHWHGNGTLCIFPRPWSNVSDYYTQPELILRILIQEAVLVEAAIEQLELHIYWVENSVFTTPDNVQQMQAQLVYTRAQWERLFRAVNSMRALLAEVEMAMGMGYH